MVMPVEVNFSADCDERVTIFRLVLSRPVFGFNRFEVIPLAGPSSAVVAYK